MYMLTPSIGCKLYISCASAVLRCPALRCPEGLAHIPPQPRPSDRRCDAPRTPAPAAVPPRHLCTACIGKVHVDAAPTRGVHHMTGLSVCTQGTLLPMLQGTLLCMYAREAEPHELAGDSCAHSGSRVPRSIPLYQSVTLLLYHPCHSSYNVRSYW